MIQPQQEQVRLLYDQANSGLVVTLLVTGILGMFLLAEEASIVTIAGWWLSTVLIVAWRWRLIQRFRCAVDVDSNPELWGRRFVLGAIAAGLNWGIGGATAADQVPLLAQALTLCVVGSMVAVGISFLGSVLVAFLGYMLGATLPLMAWMLWQFDFIHNILAVLAGIFLAGMWLAAVKFNNILTQTLFLEAKSAKLAEEANKANQAKTEFLRSMSHELRTPLNAVLGFSQILKADKTLDKKHLAAVGHIFDAGNHLLGLISELLDLAQVESNQVQLTMEAVDPGEAIQECLRLTEPLLAEYHVTIENQVAANSTSVIRADKMRLNQVLLNLLSNGMKYNRVNGKLTLTSEIVGQEKLRIAVSDTGLGIPEAHLHEVFEPFSRLGAEQRNIEGTGIGLTICKRLVEQMGGTIGVDSTPDVGSRFWIEFRLNSLHL